MSQLAAPDPPGEEDKESSPGQPWRQWGRCARREAGALPAAINRPASGPSANNTIPDTSLNSVHAWNRVVLSLLLFIKVPRPCCPPDPARDCLESWQLPEAKRVLRDNYTWQIVTRWACAVASVLYFWWWSWRGSRGRLGMEGAHEDSLAKESECPQLLSSDGLVQGHLQNGRMQMLCLCMGEK